jgi:putative nucleotidyltransferase with HDIG domain
MPIEMTTASRDRILEAVDKLPPFSPVLSRLLATLADEDVSSGELAAIIETDAVLAGNLLRVVNSPLYGRIATINSVRRAVAILGSMKIRNMVLGMSVARRWAGTRTPPQWNARQFNLHSLAVAVLADLVAIESRIDYPEGAFTAGLLHDVGKLLIAIASPAEFEMMMQHDGEPGMEASALCHAEISAAILEKWKLPAPIVEAARFHHAPDNARSGKPHLAHVIEACDHYLHTVGLGMRPSPLSMGSVFVDVSRKLDLNEKILSVAETFATEFEAIRGCL